MIEVSCPKCGGIGQAPREKINTRLVCKKCHATFHVATSGRSIFGDPPVQKEERAHGRDPAAVTAKPTRDWKENLPEFTMTGRSALIALVVSLAVAGLYFVSNRPAESLADYGKRVAQAFADGDLGRLKSHATGNSVDDLVQWYGTARPRYDTLKKQWASREVVVGVLVIDENLRQRSGEATAIIAPTKASARDASLHGMADLGVEGSKPMEFSLYFTSDQWGKWHVDGTKMRERASQLP